MPVRVNYPGPLPYQLSHYLDKLQQAQWQNDGNTSNLIQQLLAAIGELGPLPTLEAQPVPVFQASHCFPPRRGRWPICASSRRCVTRSGQCDCAREFYIERKDDERFYRELRKPMARRRPFARRAKAARARC